MAGAAGAAGAEAGAGAEASALGFLGWLLCLTAVGSLMPVCPKMQAYTAELLSKITRNSQIPLHRVVCNL